MRKKKQSTKNLIEEINWLSDQINSILGEKEKERYFEGIILTYTFIEKLLTWLVFIQIIWNKTEREKQLSENEIITIKEYFVKNLKNPAENFMEKVLDTLP